MADGNIKINFTSKMVSDTFVGLIQKLDTLCIQCNIKNIFNKLFVSFRSGA